MNTSKIIKGVVGGGRYTVTAPITQWDYGYIFQPIIEDLPATYRLDFSNDEHSGTAYPVYCGADGGEVPQSLIDIGKDIFVWLFYIGDGFGKTEYKWRIPNKLKPKNEEETPEPSQQSSIDQLIVRSNEAVERAEDAQQAIEDMSVSATTLAEGESATVTKTEQDGVVHLEFGIPTGATGATGAKGDKGDKGDTGAQGIKGDKGDKGDTGATGAKGDKGDKGDQGEQGIQGIQGIQGERGEKGDKGDKGDTGEVTLEEFYKAFPTDTASGAVASFTDGADNIPLKSLIVNIDPVQDTSSGDPSPENSCPISGWTGMQLSVNGTVIPISWQTEAGTVYGGRLDVLSGVLTVDQAMITKNTALMDTTNDDYPGWFNSGIKSLIGAGKNTSNLTGVINIGQKYGANTNGVNDTLILPRSIYGKTKAEWVALALDVQIVATLATPIEIQLTPQEVNSLLGANNIWADTGDTSVEYRADTKLYIEKLTQPEEDDMIADSAITSGQFFMVGNTLYRALTAIASGATITVGTNAQRVSLSDALNLINT